MPYTKHLSISEKQKQYLDQQAARQERIIAELYRKGHPLSPSQVESKLDADWPITSIRRAITDLTDAGVLRKLEATREGKYGRPEHYWELNTQATKQTSMFPDHETRISTAKREVEGI